MRLGTKDSNGSGKRQPSSQVAELPLSNQKLIFVSSCVYVHCVCAGIHHASSLIRTGDINETRLQWDMRYWAGQYILEVLLAVVVECCVLQYGGRTWTMAALLEHHLSSIIAGAVGELYVYWSQDHSVYRLFAPVFISILITQANETFMVISALGGERVVSSLLKVPENHFPLERVRICIAPLLIGNLAVWEAHLTLSIVQQWLSDSKFEMLIFLPFLIGALSYHFYLLRLNLRKVRRVCRIGGRTASPNKRPE
jgi:hypothetical protein